MVIIRGPIGETDVLVKDIYYKFISKNSQKRIEDLVTRFLENKIHTLFFYCGNIQRHCTNIRAHETRAGCEDREKSSWRGKEGWPKIISTNIFVPSRTTGFRRTIHFFFSSSYFRSFHRFSRFLSRATLTGAFVAPEAC